jgi:hypothetical protein
MLGTDMGTICFGLTRRRNFKTALGRNPSSQSCEKFVEPASFRNRSANDGFGKLQAMKWW